MLHRDNCLVRAALRFLCGGTIALACVSAADSAAPEGPLPSSPGPRTAPDELNPPTPQHGDIVTFVSGKQLTRVQVVRQNADSYRVEVVPDRVFLDIPVEQVASIKYDDVNPLLGDRKGPEDADPKDPVVLPAHPVSSSLVRKLNRGLDPARFSFSDEDLLVVLERLGKECDILVQIDEALRRIPAKNREWTYEAQAGATGLNLLNAVEASFPWLRIVYEADAIAITTAPGDDPPGSVDYERSAEANAPALQ